MKFLMILLITFSFMVGEEVPSISKSEIKNILKVKNEVRFYSLEDQATGLALGWTETNWDYYAKHNSDAEGICGIMPIWHPYLQDLGIKPNSIEACIAIYNFYLDQTGSKSKAIREYKGIESKKYEWLIKHTLYLRQYILKRLKEPE